MSKDGGMITIQPGESNGYIKTRYDYGRYTYEPIRHGYYTSTTFTKKALDQMKEERSIVFDRWNWETGKEEDRERFEKLDKDIKWIEENCEIVKIVAGGHY